MIQKGDTIVYKADDSVMFYWLCDIQGKNLIFFNWHANPRTASLNDFWSISTEWFKAQIKAGKIEVFSSLPLEEYGDAFERQAIERHG